MHALLPFVFLIGLKEVREIYKLWLANKQAIVEAAANNNDDANNVNKYNNLYCYLVVSVLLGLFETQIFNLTVNYAYVIVIFDH